MSRRDDNRRSNDFHEKKMTTKTSTSTSVSASTPVPSIDTEALMKRREKMKAWQLAKEKEQQLSMSSSAPVSEYENKNEEQVCSDSGSHSHNMNEKPTTGKQFFMSISANASSSLKFNVVGDSDADISTDRNLDHNTLPIVAGETAVSDTDVISVSQAVPAKVEEEEEDDPLDAFMKSIAPLGVVSGSGNQQRTSVLTSKRSHNLSPLTGPVSGSSNIDSTSDQNHSYSTSSQYETDADADDTQDEEDFLKSVVRFNNGEPDFATANSASASNAITLSDILRSLNAQADVDSNSNAVIPQVTRTAAKINSTAVGWESDASTVIDTADSTSGYDEGIDDAEEERQRREFMAAMKHKQAGIGLGMDIDSGVGIERPDAAIKMGNVHASSEMKVTTNTVGDVLYESEGDVMEALEQLESQAKRPTSLELLEESKKGKELKPIDHSTIDYMPFRKNLYIVPKSLARLTDQEVRVKRECLSVKVRGLGCPAPVDNWEQCGLSDRLLDALMKNSITSPFAIQKQSIPALMCGRDVIGVAKTGSGKTLAFLIPMFRHIQDQPPLKAGEGPIGLIMAPARELAFQIRAEAKKLCPALGLRVTCIYGGVGVADQIAELKRGAEIIVCTPGRMIDILCMQAGRMISLRRVTMVVLDEADRMFDMGFEPQIRMIIQNTREDRQTVLFSATFPKQIEKLAKNILKLPLEIVVGERSGGVNKDITQYVEVHEENDKFMRLLQLLGVWYERGNVLVFVDTQEKCDSLFQDLLKFGYPCVSLHGGKDQFDRDHTLHEFKTGLKTLLIATSVAGRGLDVPSTVCVINYNCPNHFEDYVHRVGRTGRAGKKGTAYTFISPQEENYSNIVVRALQRQKELQLQQVSGADKATIAAVNEKYLVPGELEAMANRFREKVERGEAHWVSSGFVGNKGFTFDSSEMNESQKLVSMQKRAYDIEQGNVQGDEEGDFSDEEGGTDMRTVDNVPTTSTATVSTSTASVSGLEKAKMLAASLSASNGASSTITPPSNTAPERVDIQPKAPSTAVEAALLRAKQAAQMVISTGRAGAGGLSGSGGGGGHASDGVETKYSEELEYNDYPPQVGVFDWRLGFLLLFILCSFMCKCVGATQDYAAFSTG